MNNSKCSFAFPRIHDDALSGYGVGWLKKRVFFAENIIFLTFQGLPKILTKSQSCISSRIKIVVSRCFTVRTGFENYFTDIIQYFQTQTERNLHVKKAQIVTIQAPIFKTPPATLVRC